MELSKHFLCPGADIVFPALLGAEQWLPGQVSSHYSIFSCQWRICGNNHTEIIRFRKQDVIILSLIRCFAYHSKIQETFIQLFSDLFCVAAGDVVAKIRIQFLKLPYLSRQITDLIGLGKTEVDVSAGDIIQREIPSRFYPPWK